LRATVYQFLFEERALSSTNETKKPPFDDKRMLTIAEGLEQLPQADGKQFITLFQHGSLLVEVYAPRGTDPQKPHTRDEVYLVARGTGEFINGETRQSFEAGDFLFAAAGETHRFENFSDDFAVWVLFYGPEGGEASDR
jgi:mannose-6-phosphate isomerase-like protein (cupin superfamily)